MIIKVKDGTKNETKAKDQMHKSRRKIIDVMRGTDTKDTFGWTMTDKERKNIEDAERQVKADRQAIFDEIRVPTFCPKCEKFMKGEFDRKFYFRTGRCMDCQQDFEHKLRVKGIYPLWEKMKVFQNEISIQEDIRSKFSDAYESLRPGSEFITSEGLIQKFEFAGDFNEVKEKIKTDISDIDELLVAAKVELVNIVRELKELDIDNLTGLNDVE